MRIKEKIMNNVKKKKINQSFLIAEAPLENVEFISEVVNTYEKKDGGEGFTAAVKYNGEERILFLDGGLRGSLKNAKILNKEGTMLKAGAVIDIIPTGKKDLEEGFVYTYDILA